METNKGKVVSFSPERGHGPIKVLGHPPERRPNKPKLRTTNLIEAGEGLIGIIRPAQLILGNHLQPGGPSEFDTINGLLGFLDEPKWRQAYGVWEASIIAKAQNTKGA
jgi:hypothetical protein